MSHKFGEDYFWEALEKSKRPKKRNYRLIRVPKYHKTDRMPVKTFN